MTMDTAMNMTGMNLGRMEIDMHVAVFQLENNSVILFAGWTTGTLKGILAAVILSTLVAAMYEGLLEYRHIHRLSMTIRVSRYEDCRPGMLSYPRHTVQTLLHVCQVLFGYFLMLSVMSFNIWVLVSIALGSGIGHYLVRPVVDFMFSKNEDRETFIRRVRRLRKCDDCTLEEVASMNNTEDQLADGLQSRTEADEKRTMVMYVTTV